MTVGQQLKHCKNGSRHIARINGTLKGLPSARLLSTSTAGLNWIAHQGSSIDLTQTSLDSGSLEFVTSGCGHLNVCDHRHGELLKSAESTKGVEEPSF